MSNKRERIARIGPEGILDRLFKRLESAGSRHNQFEKADHQSLAAWRAAAVTWLRCEGLITVSINRKVLPYLSREYVRD